MKKKKSQEWKSANQVAFAKWFEGLQFFKMLCLNVKNKYLNGVNNGKDDIKNHWCPEWCYYYSEKSKITSNSQWEYWVSHIPVVLVNVFTSRDPWLYCTLWVLWHATVLYLKELAPFSELMSVAFLFCFPL